MKAKKLYQKLEEDFITSEMSDDWAQYMEEIDEFICDNFKKRSMGLVCNFTSEINKVYTAVFPSKKVMQKILNDNNQDAMLFVHHPSVWDIRRAPEVFYQMDKGLLKKFKENKISIYNLHVPLDNFSPYSTSVTLANSLNIDIKKPFAHYFGVLCGVIGTVKYQNIAKLKNQFEKIAGHQVSLYQYGSSEIKNNKIAVVAGGGNDIEILKEVFKENINTFVTGITVKNLHSQKSHDFAKENKINLLGGTHYSTEKFSCIAMVDYFKKLNLPAEFIENQPVMEDM